MPLTTGARLGPYEILGPLGAQGMGDVYRAKDTRLGREARAISSLNHPHICTLFDIGREGDADYFVMELLDGETLAVRLERGPIKLDEALRIGAQIAEALAAAHKQGIVHRNLKPGSIALTKSGGKVLDFAVPIATSGGSLEVGTRRPLFGGQALPVESFDFTHDGKRLLGAARRASTTGPVLTVVTQWTSEQAQ